MTGREQQPPIGTWTLRAQLLLAVNLSLGVQYLDVFARDAADAQQFLLTRYRAVPVSAAPAAARLARDPDDSRGGPEYTLVSAYSWDMPCCQCFQLLCQRADGSTLAIFEHDEPQPGWFAGRPAVADSCGARECQIVQLDRQLAATWQRDGRQVTVIGVRDMAEVEQLLSWLDAAPDLSG